MNSFRNTVVCEFLKSQLNQISNFISSFLTFRSPVTVTTSSYPRRGYISFINYFWKIKYDIRSIPTFRQSEREREPNWFILWAEMDGHWPIVNRVGTSEAETSQIVVKYGRSFAGTLHWHALGTTQQRHRILR